LKSPIQCTNIPYDESTIQQHAKIGAKFRTVAARALAGTWQCKYHCKSVRVISEAHRTRLVLRYVLIILFWYYTNTWMYHTSGVASDLASESEASDEGSLSDQDIEVFEGSESESDELEERNETLGDSEVLNETEDLAPLLAVTSG
jgi:hypothetical protein